MQYKEILYALTKAEIRYLVCGGLAVNIFGVPRMTADIDILMDFELDNLIKFNQVTKNFGYSPLVPQVKIETLIDKKLRNDYVKNKNLIAYNYFHHQGGKMSIDVLIDVPIPFNEMWDRKQVNGNGLHSFYSVSLDDLIALKKYSNRLQDQNDILLLSKLK